MLRPDPVILGGRPDEGLRIFHPALQVRIR
jgi:hypothetical protein